MMIRNKHIQIVTSFIVIPASTKKEDFKKCEIFEEEESKKNEPIEEVRRMQRRKLSRRTGQNYSQ